MPSFLEKHSLRYFIFAIMALTVILLGIVTFYNPVIGLIGFIIAILPFYMIYDKIYHQRKELEEYIATLSYRVKQVGQEAMMELPVGIMLYNDQYDIEWTNAHLLTLLDEESLVGQSLYDIAEDIIPTLKKDAENHYIRLNNRDFKITIKSVQKIVYFFDATEEIELKTKYENEKTVISVIFLDNYDEVTQGIDDQMRGSLNNIVTSLLNKWAQEHNIYLKRVSSDRFVAVFNETILSELEEEKFTILDEIRDRTAKRNVPLTLSVGIGTGELNMLELGKLAQSGLDLALGRGGDQVAIKSASGKVQFYGGKTNPIEKRTRVRARVISLAIKELIMGSDKVVILGHKVPDMDSIGSALGIRKIAKTNGKDAYIVINPTDNNNNISKVLTELKKTESIYNAIITPNAALEMITEDTLIVVVDTHRPSMVVDERLLQDHERVIVIDHHRRGDEFIDNPILVYMEPYASSTAELVTELFEYQPKLSKINSIEATVLLAGIIVDTKNFTLRAGARTFDAASYLRSVGADTILVQKLLKEDKDTFIKKAQLIEQVYFYRDGIAITVGLEDRYYSQVILAQTADALLSMEDVVASFAISYRNENTIGMSARSLGDVNVQLIMEQLGGGGHLTNAATLIKDISIQEAHRQLQEAIDEYMEGRNK